ncbi:MAG TPA: toll/interleukin-1 receptor domain-containing protein, partial [Geminicoccaceae bacterium]|nr:toll/interleukin-1 receptor domain-containing protein [Geminicoccaceae bacterium]
MSYTGRAMPDEAPPRRALFISYNWADKTWAEWIAWQLEGAGYSVVIQAWDFRPGHNFVLEMDSAARSAERTLLVLSPSFLGSDFTAPEWAAAIKRDPTGEKRLIVPVRVVSCRPDGLLGQINYIDLVDRAEADAAEELLNGVKLGRAKPDAPPGFPGVARAAAEARTIEKPARFPGALPPMWNVPHHRNPHFTGRDEL